MAKRGKKGKIAWIVGISITSLCLLYFGGGTLGATIAFNAIIKERTSTIDDLDKDFYKVFRIHDDFPYMKDRQVVQFDSNGRTLTGYYYQRPDPVAVAICIHGMNSLADGVDAMYQEFMYNHGCEVFSFDLSGAGRSEGTLYAGLSQSVIDTASAVSYFDEHLNTTRLPYVLIGHSMGGYGAAAALDYCSNVKAVITFSAYDQPRQEMFESAKKRMGGFADFTYPAFALAAQMKYGDRCKVKASDVLSSHPEVESLHFIGTADDVVDPSSSLATAVKENPKIPAESVYLEGIDHKIPWVDMLSRKKGYGYLEQLKAATSEEERSQIIAAIDKSYTSYFSVEVQTPIENLMHRLFFDE